MKIDRIYLEHFGKFCGKDLEFSEGLNIIYGDNESGKTTLHTALKTTFYPLTAKSKENQEKICYIPANEKKAEWTVDFTTDDGRKFTSDFSMGKTKRGCAQKTVDKQLGTEWKTAEMCLGEALFQIPEEMFDNLAYMKDRSLTEMRNAPLVNRQLAMFSQQDKEEEELDAVKKINAAISLIERKNHRLDKLEQTRRELLEQKRELRGKEQEHQALTTHMERVVKEQEQEKENIAKLLQRIEEVEVYDQYEKMKQAEALQQRIANNEQKLKKLEEEQKQTDYLAALSLEHISKCEALERELSDSNTAEELHIPGVPESKNSRYLWFSMILSVLSVVFAGCILWQPMLFAVLAGIGLLLSGFCWYQHQKNKKICMQEQQRQKQEQEQKRQTLCQQKEALLAQFRCENAKALHEQYLSYQNLLHQHQLLSLSLENDRKLFAAAADAEEFAKWKPQFADRIPEKSTESKKELLREKAAAEARLNEKNVEYANLSGKALNYKGDLELRIRLEEELAVAEEEITALTNRLNLLKKTRGYMEQAKEDLKTGYLPRLNLEVKKILSEMGLTHVEQVYVDEMLDIAVRTEHQNFLKNGLQLSMGTRDQLYFALRLAICRLAYADGEKIPLFLDDPFVRLDNLRFRKMINYLNSCRDLQILYFTCHRRALREGLGGKVIQL